MVVGVAIDVVLFAAVLRQLMNLLSEAFVEVPAVLPVEEAAVPPNGMVVLVVLLFFAAKAELVRLPAVTSAIAMKMTMLANASDFLFVYIRFDIKRDLL